MRLTGRGVWGEPEDRVECIRVVHHAIELERMRITGTRRYLLRGMVRCALCRRKMQGAVIRKHETDLLLLPRADARSRIVGSRRFRGRAPTVLDRLLAAGMRESRARLHLAAGRIRMDGIVVTDTGQLAPPPPRIVIAN